MRIRVVSIAAVILLGVTVSLCLLYGISPTSLRALFTSEKGQECSNTKTAVECWRARIRAVGGDAAYVEFADSVKGLPGPEPHNRAHFFGAAVYEEYGEKGLAVCEHGLEDDLIFAYGCFHEFWGRTIADKGIQSLGDAYAECNKQMYPMDISCQHSLGHGMLAYLGYDTSSLQQALGACKSQHGGESARGCYGGVFMEFYLRTMLGENASVRPQSDKNAAICGTLSGRVGFACYFWLPWWWNEIYHLSVGTDDSFIRMGELCRAGATSSEMRRGCLEGTGYMAVISTHDSAQRSNELCHDATQNVAGLTHCLSGASNRIHTNAVCAGLGGVYLAHCNAYAENDPNVVEQPSSF